MLLRRWWFALRRPRQAQHARPWKRPLSLERLESRVVPAADPFLAPAIPLPPPEPALLGPLCPQTNPGIYYNVANQTVCVVGSEAGDQVSVYRDGGNIVFVLDTGTSLFTFSTSSDLVDRFDVDSRGGNDAISVTGDVRQPNTIDAGTGDDHVGLGGGPGLVFGGEGNDT